MSAPPYMKLYIADYLADTTHLRTVEHGAYLLLLMALWRAGGKLPKDPAKLARIAQMSSEEWAEVAPAVMDFFTVRGGSLTQKRATSEIAKYQSAVSGSKRAGKASASRRANKNSELGSTDVDVSVERKSNQPEPEPEPEPDNSSEDKSSGAEAPRDDLFADDPNRMAWALAKDVLGKNGGMEAEPARKFFGALISRHKLEAREMLPALAAAVANQTQDPKGYLTRSAQGVAKRKAEPAGQKRVSFV